MVSFALLISSHGRQKFYTGVGLWGLGALTNNRGLQEVGGGLAKLGLASKVAAHFFKWKTITVLVLK